MFNIGDKIKWEGCIAEGIPCVECRGCCGDDASPNDKIRYGIVEKSDEPWVMTKSFIRIDISCASLVDDKFKKHKERMLSV